MVGVVGHLARIVRIGRTLARHDALFVLDYLDEAPTLALWAARKVAGRPAPGVAGRPGQRLAAALNELGPSFIKLGQAISVRADIVGQVMADDLGALRDALPPFPGEQARRTIALEFGAPAEALFVDFEDRAIAAASIAQVHFAYCPAGETDRDTRPVAVKILRPDIEESFRRDLDFFEWLAGLAARFAPKLRRLKPVEVVQTLRAAVELELDLRMEAAAASELAENFADADGYRVPRVDWTRTGRRVLTLERVEGIPIDDVEALRAAGHDLPALAAAVIRIFLTQALRDGFFHADPHHGNLFVDEAGHLVPVDFGIMGRLDRRTRAFLAEMLLAFVQGDYQRAAAVHFEAGYVSDKQSMETFAQACRSIGEPILGKPVSEISIARLLQQLFRVTETFAMETQPQLLLLQKTMVVAEGVARSLDPEINFWAVAQPTIEDWVAHELSPERRLRRAADDAVHLIERLPGLVDRAERTARILAETGVKLDVDGGHLPPAQRARATRPWRIAFAVAVAALLLVLFGRL